MARDTPRVAPRWPRPRTAPGWLRGATELPKEAPLKPNSIRHPGDIDDVSSRLFAPIVEQGPTVPAFL
eukprot:9496326-Pyramimonas_sp.AAC.1